MINHPRSLAARLLMLAISAGFAAAAPVDLYRIDLRPGTDAYRFAARNDIPVHHIGQSALLAGRPVAPGRHPEVASISAIYRGESQSLRWVHLRRGGTGLDGSIPSLFSSGDMALVRAGELAKAGRRDGLMVTDFSGQPIPLSKQANIPNPELAQDPAVLALAQTVTIEHFRATVESLQAFPNRNANGNYNEQAAEWIRSTFLSFGIADVKLDTFTFQSWYLVDSTYYYRTDTCYNVIATIPGTIDTNTVYVVGGHYDTSVWLYPWDTLGLWAPGADDNGSGTAAALEIARVMAANPPNCTVKFMAYDCEEWGLFGSQKAAQDALASGADIGCMLNYDMVGSAGNDSAFVSKVYPGSELQAQFLGQCASWYGTTNDTSLVTEYNSVYLSGSDSWRYYEAGYRVTYSEELNFSDHYHEASDSTTYMNMRYATSIVRAGAGLLATLADYPQPVSRLAIRNLGDGSSLCPQWQPGPSNIAFYKVYTGRQTGNYDRVDTSYTARDTIGGLMADSTYYIGIVAVDNAGRPCPFITEAEGTPRPLPQAPAEINGTPIAQGISVQWRSNSELDFAGYRLYRAVNDTLAFDSLNTTLSTDTSYTDFPLSGANRYYYRARAFDNDGNASPPSERVYGRPLTLDQGVLVVDETYNWTSGTLPRDSTQDRFYDSVLTGYQHEQYEYGTSAERPSLCDLVPYSAVLWHGDDNTTPMASGSTGDLGKYLDYGGNLWFVGWKPAGDLEGNANYPRAFADTSFVHTYFKVDSVYLSGTSDSFQAATGLLGYPGISVDPAKVPLTAWGGTMRYIEGFVPATGGEVIYAMDMKNASSPFEGRTCGVRYMGPTYRAVLFGFPLYFMDRDQAKAAAQQVMADFGMTGTSAPPGDRPVAAALNLFPGKPNPFNRATTIRYHIPAAEEVQLAVYNILGQKVRLLAGGAKPPGDGSASWDGRDERGDEVPAGIYMVRLAAGGANRVVRLALIR